jgi:hypothetical protein
MYARKGRRWFSRMLARVDPSAFADEIESYIAGLPTDRVRELAAHMARDLPPPERMQFNLYVDERSLSGDADDLLGRRLIAFLRQNLRSAQHLGPEALERIFTPLQPEGLHMQPRPLNAGAIALAVLAFLVAVVPLAAQYAHQRGMITGLNDGSVYPAAPVAQVQRVAVSRKLRAGPARERSKPPARHTRAQRRGMAFVRHPIHQRRIARASIPRPHSPVRRVASVWKFDRRNYAYFATPHQTLPQRAKLLVQSYLNAMIAGNTRSALRHLGLPPDADLVNLSEVPIISRHSSARIVWVKPQADGMAQVDADIHGRGGEYFEVFYVAEDGPAVRITDRYYIPVGK